MKTPQRVLRWFNQQALLKRLRQAAMAYDAEKHLWTEHPNNYREKDLGFQTIAGQSVRVKRVFETSNLKGPNWLTLDKSFRVSVYP